MALLFECMGKCCRNMLDTADIVRDACYHQFIAQNVKGVCYSRMQATLYLFLGRLLGRMKQYRAALHYFQLTADLNPKSEVAHCWIGWAYSQLSSRRLSVRFRSPQAVRMRTRRWAVRSCN